MDDCNVNGSEIEGLVGNAGRKSGLIDFKIESNQINLQAPFVMEKYAKFQLGKNKLGKIDAAGLLCALLTLSVSLSISILPSALINLNFHRQMAGKSFQLLSFPTVLLLPRFPAEGGLHFHLLRFKGLSFKARLKCRANI